MTICLFDYIFVCLVFMVCSKVRLASDYMDDALQTICRDYLSRMRGVAKRYGLSLWIDDLISRNARKECVGTLEEVELLSRMVDDERIARKDIPRLMGESYRKCDAKGYFGKIRRLRRVGIYSKVSAMLLKMMKDGKV